MTKLRMQNENVRFAIASMRLALNHLAGLRPRGLCTRAETIGGVGCEWVWSRTSEHSAPITLYFHGGGYVAGSPASHYGVAKLLSQASASRVLVVDYRLAPEHAYPAQLDDALAVYRALLERGIVAADLALAGDSAGGNLGLALLLQLRALRLPLPVAFVSYSPWTDLTHSGASIARNAALDDAIPVAMLDPLATMYAGAHDRRDPLISPLFGDLAGLPPLHLHVARDEVLLDDTLRLVARARAAGVAVEHRVWERVPHAFPVFAEMLPEGRAAVEESGEFLRRRFAATGARAPYAAGDDDLPLPAEPTA